MFRILASLVLLALPLSAALWLWPRLHVQAHATRRPAISIVAFGAVLAGVASYLERLILGWTGLSVSATEAGEAGAVLAMFLLAAPLEEALKVLAVWPLYRSHRITNRGSGLLFAVLAASGFAAVESVVVIWTSPPGGLVFVRALLAQPAHLYCAALWGYALGSGRGARGRWFSLAWLFAMLLHAVYDHIVFGRGPALLVLTVPLLAAGTILGWGALKDLGSVRADSSSKGPLSLRRVEPPSLAVMRRALKRSDRPLLVHWIAVGALVTIGVMLVALAAAVYVGHRVGIDFAMADEADVRSSGPIVLLATAVLAAFPISGYLVARASAATSVLEPAMGAGLAMVAVIGALSITAPISVVFALAVAPIAFALACGGAWFGMEH